MKQDSKKIRRSSFHSISPAASNAKDDSNQRLQDKSESAWTRDSSWNVLDEISRKEINPSSVYGVMQGTGSRQHQHDERHTDKK